jgi:hypothetical protein
MVEWPIEPSGRETQMIDNYYYRIIMRLLSAIWVLNEGSDKTWIH